jgi:D-amino-acid oxidase
MLARARRLLPVLADAEVLRTLVGLRPARPTIRLEPELRPAGPILHCYGHGGAGISLSWGCAEEVAHHAREILR